jgi:hypothetical protein
VLDRGAERIDVEFGDPVCLVDIRVQGHVGLQGLCGYPMR